VQAGVRITVVLGASRSDKQLTQFKLSLLERRQGARTEDKEGKGMWFTYSVVKILASACCCASLS
jgi:hypothetical protein